eukprot:TRINITY_DN67502_c7_g3_i2.p2 TRINITY_DN67502_c7_g3~~TRINITY_DN67502_c7_g3_i2.p2  ORF type:complete len:260 (+),score=116.40 TRINITY_DN67502_c7_g3_i2:1410-2189(+)
MSSSSSSSSSSSAAAAAVPFGYDVGADAPHGLDDPNELEFSQDRDACVWTRKEDGSRHFFVRGNVEMPVLAGNEQERAELQKAWLASLSDSTGKKRLAMPKSELREQSLDSSSSKSTRIPAPRFSWTVWVSVSESNFAMFQEKHVDEQQPLPEPVFCWFMSAVPGYASNTQCIKSHVQLRRDGLRPLVTVDPAEHDLGRQSVRGVSWRWVKQLAAVFSYQQHQQQRKHAETDAEDDPNVTVVAPEENNDDDDDEESIIM